MISSEDLTFEDGKYYERTGANAEYEDKAPVQANVLKALEKAPMTVSELAAELGKDKEQIAELVHHYPMLTKLPE